MNMRSVFSLFALIITMPNLCWALSDACTNPQEYTVDERCYVTDKQKKTAPYNAVVAMTDGEFVYCTGTIVKGKSGKPYVYTAKHCTDHDRNGASDDKLVMKLQDGREYDVYKNNLGDYDIEEKINFDGDWAIYSIKTSDVPMVEKTNRVQIGIFPYELWYKAKVIGYGGLKIMSDAEIEDFKDYYLTYLRKYTGIEAIDGTETTYGFYDGGVDTREACVQNFLNNDWKYWNSLRNDNDKLKVSYCKYTSTGRQIGCQGWGGNSGGGIFDSDNKIMGIHTRGNDTIGGKHHAGKDSFWTGDDIDSSSLLR